MKKIKYIIVAAVALTSCNYLDIEPIGQVIPHKITEYRALMTECYRTYPYYDGHAYTSLLTDEIGMIYMDGFYGDGGEPMPYNYTWDYTPGKMKDYSWRDYYRSIFHANAVIDGVMKAYKDSQESPEQIMGEAYAMRAYSHFELVNLYANTYDKATAATDRAVPISIRIDIEQPYARASVKQVYDQILADIDQASKLMTTESQTDPKYSYRFSLRALTAFKARVKLYMTDWDGALSEATSIITKTPLVNLNTLGTSSADKKLVPWVATSVESIMALDRPFSGVSGDLYLSSMLSQKILDLLDQTKDNRGKYIKRKDRYINGDYNNPILVGYRVDRSSGDRSTFRSAEIYLIAAEAAAHTSGKIEMAKQYLKKLQENRLKPEAYTEKAKAVDAMTQDQLLEEIANERTREFVLEGQRWFDLRRTTRPQIVKTFDKNTYTLNKNDARYTLPIPRSAIDNNPGLGN